jgi:MbtH protein
MMNTSFPDRRSTAAFVSGNFTVLINHEEQYGIWPADKPVPEKWRSTGVAGSKEECLAYVRGLWTDMRPLSIRKRHQGTKANATGV